MHHDEAVGQEKAVKVGELERMYRQIGDLKDHARS